MASLTTAGVRFGVGDELTSRRAIFPQHQSASNACVWVFHQTAAPTGWTKVTTQNDKALRLVSGTGGGAGGTNSFSSMMRDFNIGGAVSVPTTATGGTTLATPQIPGHSHPNSVSLVLSAVPALFNPDGSFAGWNGGDVGRFGGWTRVSPDTGDTSPTSLRSQPHSHPFSGSATVPNQPVNIAVQYIDVLICTFDG